MKSSIFEPCFNKGPLWNITALTEEEEALVYNQGNEHGVVLKEHTAEKAFENVEAASPTQQVGTDYSNSYLLGVPWPSELVCRLERYQTGGNEI